MLRSYQILQKVLIFTGTFSKPQYLSRLIQHGNSVKSAGYILLKKLSLCAMTSSKVFSFFLLNKLQIVQEYERAVIFRLGRLLPGGAKGPGILKCNNIVVTITNKISLQECFKVVLEAKLPFQIVWIFLHLNVYRRRNVDAKFEDWKSFSMLIMYQMLQYLLHYNTAQN